MKLQLTFMGLWRFVFGGVSGAKHRKNTKNKMTLSLMIAPLIFIITHDV